MWEQLEKPNWATVWDLYNFLQRTGQGIPPLPPPPILLYDIQINILLT